MTFIIPITRLTLVRHLIHHPEKFIIPTPRHTLARHLIHYLDLVFPVHCRAGVPLAYHVLVRILHCSQQLGGRKYVLTTANLGTPWDSVWTRVPHLDCSQSPSTPMLGSSFLHNSLVFATISGRESAENIWYDSRVCLHVYAQLSVGAYYGYAGSP